MFFLFSAIGPNPGGRLAAFARTLPLLLMSELEVWEVCLPAGDYCHSSRSDWRPLGSAKPFLPLLTHPPSVSRRWCLMAFSVYSSCLALLNVSLPLSLTPKLSLNCWPSRSYLRLRGCQLRSRHIVSLARGALAFKG